jgi:hypothetical protein
MFEEFFKKSYIIQVSAGNYCYVQRFYLIRTALSEIAMLVASTPQFISVT